MGGQKFFTSALWLYSSSVSSRSLWIILRLTGEHGDNNSVNSLNISVEDGVRQEALLSCVRLDDLYLGSRTKSV